MIRKILVDDLVKGGIDRAPDPTPTPTKESKP